MPNEKGYIMMKAACDVDEAAKTTTGHVIVRVWVLKKKYFGETRTKAIHQQADEAAGHYISLCGLPVISRTIEVKDDNRVENSPYKYFMVEVTINFEGIKGKGPEEPEPKVKKAKAKK